MMPIQQVNYSRAELNFGTRVRVALAWTPTRTERQSREHARRLIGWCSQERPLSTRLWRAADRYARRQRCWTFCLPTRTTTVPQISLLISYRLSSRPRPRSSTLAAAEMLFRKSLV